MLSLNVENPSHGWLFETRLVDTFSWRGRLLIGKVCMYVLESLRLAADEHALSVWLLRYARFLCSTFSEIDGIPSLPFPVYQCVFEFIDQKCVRIFD